MMILRSMKSNLPRGETGNKKVLTNEFSVVVKRLKMKDILVTPLPDGKREVFYVDQDDPEPDMKEREETYDDWRLETVKPYSSGKKKGPIKSRPKSCLIQVPTNFPSLFKVDYAEDDLHSILNILGGSTTTVNVLDGYLLLRLEQFERERRNSCTKFLYLSPHMAPVSWEDDPKKITVDLKWKPTQIPPNTDLIAPQYSCKHMYLAVLIFSKRTVKVFDSSWHWVPELLRKGQIQAVLRALCLQDHLEWKVTFKKSSSPQHDEYSCGIYTIFYAENLIECEGENLTGDEWEKLNCVDLSEKEVTKIRRKIVKELLGTTEPGRHFLQAISD